MTEAESKGLMGAVADLGGRLLAALPAQFLALVLIVVALLLFVDRRDAARERLLTPILAGCLQHPKE